MKGEYGRDILFSSHSSEQVTACMLENYRHLVRFCTYLTKNRWDGEDLAQETMCKAVKSYGKEEIRSIQLPLLFTIARNQWIDTLRAKNREQELKQEPWYEPIENLHNLYSIFETMVLQFTLNQIVTFLFKEVFQFSIADIATMLCSSEGAIKSSLFRMRNRLHAIQKEPLRDRHEEDEGTVHMLVQSIQEQKPMLLLQLIPELSRNKITNKSSTNMILAA
ncbi:sigma factor [Bacillus sp. 165]|uniref:sigma factor n=1 Tax=Bacillus sp. 165 TaxID=1529117 RepID=UPI001AD9F625|nr:sigma factor [Bacillus sp. 165]MBO9129226.1 RNA polymerase subunit sigma-70 [Bacillus sp. 165]